MKQHMYLSEIWEKSEECDVELGIPSWIPCIKHVHSVRIVSTYLRFVQIKSLFLRAALLFLPCEMLSLAKISKSGSFRSPLKFLGG